MENRLGAENTERLTKRLSHLLSRREGTVVGTERTGGGYVQDGLLGRVLCRCESLHDAQDIGTVLADSVGVLAEAARLQALVDECADMLGHAMLRSDGNSLHLAGFRAWEMLTGARWEDK